MPRLSINQLAEFTGKSNATIKKRLDGMEFEKEGHAYIYDSADALAAIYGQSNVDANGTPKSLTEARTRESLAKAEKTELEVQTLRRERIPIDTLNDVNDAFFGLLKTKIMNSQLTELDKRELIDGIREIPTQLKW